MLCTPIGTLSLKLLVKEDWVLTLAIAFALKPTEIQGVQSTINLHQIVETQWETVCKEQQQQQTNPLCSSLGLTPPLVIRSNNLQ